jgi:hypothetical protein
MPKDNPSPLEVAVAVQRVKQHMETTFELDLNGWRMVYLVEAQAMPSWIKPETSMIFYTPELVVPTPYMPTIGGRLAVTLESLRTGRATIIYPSYNSTVGFRASNEKSADWLRLQLAKCAGMRYRRHRWDDPTKIVFTKDA